MILDRFNRDQHESLLRQHFHIKQTSSVNDYADRFVALVEQLSAYHPKPDPHAVTARFIDGLIDSIRAVVIMHKPPDLDTAISLALLQEEAQESLDPSRRKDPKKLDGASYLKSASFRSGLPLPPPPTRPHPAVEDKRPANKGPSVDDKLSTLRSYRKAQGLCMRCGEKWGPGHRCAPQLQLHVLQEVFNLCEPCLVDEAPTTTEPDSDAGPSNPH